MSLLGSSAVGAGNAAASPSKKILDKIVKIWVNSAGFGPN